MNAQTEVLEATASDESPQIDTGPLSAQGRLREWARVRHWPAVNAFPEESPMYAVLRNPGRATNTQSDGGMAMMAERMGGALMATARAMEVESALHVMPRHYRTVIQAMYYVERRERPRTAEAAAEVSGMELPTFRKAMDHALVWLQGRLCLEATRHPSDSSRRDPK